MVLLNGRAYRSPAATVTLGCRSLTVEVLSRAAIKQYRDRQGAVFVKLPMNHPQCCPR